MFNFNEKYHELVTALPPYILRKIQSAVNAKYKEDETNDQIDAIFEHFKALYEKKRSYDKSYSTKTMNRRTSDVSKFRQELRKSKEALASVQEQLRAKQEAFSNMSRILTQVQEDNERLRKLLKARKLQQTRHPKNANIPQKRTPLPNPHLLQPDPQLFSPKFIPYIAPISELKKKVRRRH